MYPHTDFTINSDFCEFGWCEGGVRQQRNDGVGCATMRERPESVESPFTYVTERPNLPQLGLFHPCFLSKSCFRVISMIKIVIWDQSKVISLIFEKIES